ncbi:hypothetical protein [Devosia sp. CAU 1758]
MIGFGLDWAVVLLPLLWLALDRFVIPVEERRIEHAFGQSYLDYAATTRRWLYVNNGASDLFGAGGLKDRDPAGPCPPLVHRADDGPTGRRLNS